MNKILCTWVLALCGIGAAAAPTTPSSPDLASVAVFNAWLTAFNSNDLGSMEAFHERYGRGVRDAQRDLDMRQRTGGFDVHLVESATSTSLVALLRERASGRFGRIHLDIGAETPVKITGLRLQPAQAAIARSPPAASIRGQAQVIASLQSYLEAEVVADRFAGAVLVAKDGAVLFERAYGFADRENRIPNATATRFHIGSMNKMFTAVAILQLVEAGKIKLNDPLAAFLPNYPNQDLARRVTIDQLLTHRGGTGDIFVPEYFANKKNIRTLDDYIDLLGARGVGFEPGERFEYSNYGYILLGAVIERVTGRTYYDYVKSQIFDRAGMARTGSEPESRLVDALSVGYTRRAGESQWLANSSGLPYRGTSAGGGYSTVRDLLAFAEALRADKLLGAKYTKLLMQGYALRNQLGDGSGFVGHNGGSPGMNGDLRIYPQSGYVTIALCNVDPPAADAITELLDGGLPVRP